eukprot:362238-Chlamydomonas_euryale.AAC.1
MLARIRHFGGAVAGAPLVCICWPGCYNAPSKRCSIMVDPISAVSPSIAHADTAAVLAALIYNVRHVAPAVVCMLERVPQHRLPMHVQQPRHHVQPRVAAASVVDTPARTWQCVRCAWRCARRCAHLERWDAQQQAGNPVGAAHGATRADGAARRPHAKQAQLTGCIDHAHQRSVDLGADDAMQRRAHHRELQHGWGCGRGWLT